MGKFIYLIFYWNVRFCRKLQNRKPPGYSILSKQKNQDITCLFKHGYYHQKQIFGIQHKISAGRFYLQPKNRKYALPGIFLF